MPPPMPRSAAIPATGATAGIPGTFTPAASMLATGGCRAVGSLLHPERRRRLTSTTAWTTGQYAQHFATTGAPGRFHWSARCGLRASPNEAVALEGVGRRRTFSMEGHAKLEKAPPSSIDDVIRRFTGIAEQEGGRWRAPS